MKRASFKLIISFAIVAFASFIITMFGVFFFFKPVAESDVSFLILPPVVGVIYITLCALIFLWAYKELSCSYKAAMVLILPQAALIIDLMLRGDRGVMTTIAGLILLFAIWLPTAFIHEKFLNQKSLLSLKSG